MIYNNDFIKNIQKLSICYQKILHYIAQNKGNQFDLKYSNHEKYQKLFNRTMDQHLKEPEQFHNLSSDYVLQINNLMSDAILRFMNNQHDTMKEHLKQNEGIDRRFRDPSWTHNIFFDFIKQYYLLTAEWLKRVVDQYELDKHEKQHIEFLLKQFIYAMSPSNFILTNPEVLKESLKSQLRNIVRGMENFLKDIKKSSDLVSISTSHPSYFEIGKNIATTEGKVIYQNDLMQLICYKPNKNTHKIPILIIPPWINKYYILDLSEHNSLIRWLVNNNFQVFLVSWINPDQKLAEKDFEDYLQEGILDACDVIYKMGYKKVNTLGYCIGGTLLVSALGYMKKARKNFINSATLLATLIDFSNPGELGILLSEELLEIVGKDVEQKGCLESRHISNSFSLIRANDLIWSFFVNNYLLGKSPNAFDILFWNSDTTNLPKKMYFYYMENMYLKNNLIQPNKLTMLGKKIDVTKIDIPIFFLGAKTDHIALWESVYDGYKMLVNSDSQFCLADGGHIAGILNPPTSGKYSYSMSDKVFDKPEDWEKSAAKHNGSWWNGWKEWLVKNSGSIKKSIDYNAIASLEEAPGSYVHSNPKGKNSSNKKHS